MRGDHSRSRKFGLCWPGPPPRARGPLGVGGSEGQHLGTTPACAGTTRPGPRRGPEPWDHPRVRGDHFNPPRPATRRRGPPPRAREPPDGHPPDDRPGGTTPACAGTTWRRGRRHTEQRDHPRVRGDHSPPSAASRASAGPPPRARGPQGPRPPAHVRAGTTPACAGTTPASGRHRAGRRDHPRVRGDHAPVVSVVVLMWGPPPRARGPQFVTCGFIRPGGRFYPLLEKRAYPLYVANRPGLELGVCRGDSAFCRPRAASRL